MHRSGPPRPAGAAGLRVRRVVGRPFEGSSASSLDPDLRVYLGDMVRPYQLALREDLLQRSVGHNYGEMAEDLIRAAVPEDEPVDLLVLAFAIPDVRPGRSSALHLSNVCPGSPLAFALCEQGLGAAHTALRTAGAYARSSDVRRALVIVVEQAALHYEPARTADGAPPVIPSGANAVAVICERTDHGDGLTVRQYPQQTAESANDLVGKEIAELGADRARTVLILGSGLACVDLYSAGCRQIILADLGQPYTGQWTELARGLSGWSAQGALILVADYDRHLQCLSLCVIDTALPPGSAHPGGAAVGAVLDPAGSGSPA
ncbi:MAG TPA: hypothetical protein VGX23_11275 [Actinocrinis sp.]|nr:hypothetical protein [Actinocrinis sp.]